jgi:hypothetical protein
VSRWAAALALVLLLAACGREGGKTPHARPSPHGLEAAAIAAGMVEDPDAADPTGLYARDTDRLCLAPSAGRFRVGMTVDYDEQQGCAGTGMATHDGALLHITMDRSDCQFDARFEGDRIVLPGDLPEGCHTLCRGRASLAGLTAERLSGSAAEAVALRDRGGRLLCGG